MSLYKRKGSEVYWVGFTVNGVRIQRSSGTTSKAKAQEFHDRLKAEVWNQVKLGARPDPLWDDVAMHWLSERTHMSNYPQYRTRIRWLHKHLGGKTVSEVSAGLIDTIRAELAKDHAPGTVNLYLTAISCVLKYAMDREMLEKMPKIRKLPTASRRIRWITPAEVEAICKHLPDYAAVMVRFSLSTGLRRKNVVKLRWDQIDMQRHIAMFDPEEVKNREALLVPLNQDAINIIRQQIGQHPVYVFTRNGTVMKDIPRKWWDKAREAAGIEDFRWHDLRHTWASWHIQAGTNPLELQELGGWKNVAMLRRYAHFSRDKLHEAASRIVTPPTTLTVVGKKNQ